MGRNSYNPALQVSGLRELENLHYIEDFVNVRSFKGDHRFTFSLTHQKIGDEIVITNFSKYKIRIEYSRTIPPKIFIDAPAIEKAKHMWGDKSLCLYHRDDFKWGDDKSIAKDLIPWVYMWIYFYELWLKTGKWYGEEHTH